MRIGRPAKDPSFVSLVLVTAVSPFATDTYIAALPEVQRSLDTTPGAAQLTMTSFLLGFALGQLVCGPLSDATGRRRILIVSTLSFAVLSVVCAVAPGVGILIAARAVQGFAGGCGLAVGRAVVSDRHSGGDAAVRFGVLASAVLLAPVVAPAVGGAILLVGDWRTIFLFLAGLGLVMAIAVVLGIPETLPPQARSASGIAETGRRMASLLRRRPFLVTIAVQSLATAGFFTYIGGSSFVLQQQLGLSPSQYTILFVSNAAAMVTFSLVFSLTVRRVGSVRLRALGVGTSTSAALALVIYSSSVDAPQVAVVWILMGVTVAGMGFSFPATTTIAQDIGRATGGTASALQGGVTFGVGAAATPLTGLTGQTGVAGMAALMAAFFLCATAVLVVTRLSEGPRGGHS
jgi:MFS transporter, DHA1 family, multidrug resistance protein